MLLLGLSVKKNPPILHNWLFSLEELFPVLDVMEPVNVANGSIRYSETGEDGGGFLNLDAISPPQMSTKCLAHSGKRAQGFACILKRWRRHSATSSASLGTRRQPSPFPPPQQWHPACLGFTFHYYQRDYVHREAGLGPKKHHISLFILAQRRGGESPHAL